MEENKIPTAKEYLLDNFKRLSTGSLDDKISEFMIEFAKIHVKNALENASCVPETNSQSIKILESYPLTNIK